MTDSPQPPDLDPDLWVLADGYEGRLFLVGNPHTHRGRISAWSEALNGPTNVSKYEITDASDAARRWIEGYLSGNEPSAGDFLGIDELAAGELADDDPGLARWRAALKDFRDTGMMPALSRVPTIPFSDAATFDHVPWTWAGGQIWIWTDKAWSVADPQPKLDGALLAGSPCAVRGYHDLIGADGHHAWCVDCGGTTEVFPRRRDADAGDPFR
jgi:hypothetical protein